MSDVLVRAALVQMTTMTGLSSIASLSLGLSMSMSNQSGDVGQRTAKLQSQLSMIATPATGDTAGKSRLRRFSHGGTPSVLTPPAEDDEAKPASVLTPHTVDPSAAAGRRTPSPRRSFRRQPAVCGAAPSPTGKPPAGTTTTNTALAPNAGVTVINF